MILVSGATGRVGGQVAAQLAAMGVPTRALTRNPRVGHVVGDLADPDTLAPVLDGVDAVFLVFPSVTADAAAAHLVRTLVAHTNRIVYLSAAGVPDDPTTDGVTPDGTILGSHAHLEHLIATSGADWTFLRSSGFAANTLHWAPQIRQGDTVRWFHGAATRALIHEHDLAAVAVRALLDDGHTNTSHHLTGPRQLTQVQQLHAIGAAMNRPLRFEELDPRTARETLFTGLPPAMADSIIDGHAAMIHTPEPVTTTVADLTGHPARPFAQWAHDHAEDFH